MKLKQEVHMDKLHEEVLLLQLCDGERRIQDILHKNHTENNCDCVDTNDTAIMKSEGATDMEICLQCFGALGNIY